MFAILILPPIARLRWIGAALLLALFATPVAAQNIAAPAAEPNIAARLVPASIAAPGEELLMAITFDPKPGWHGYWENPGDAGYGMRLAWTLPAGWTAGKAQYPVPERLEFGGLMNHIYKGPYTVLVPLAVPADAAPVGLVRIQADAEWLACTDAICVPERDSLQLDVVMGADIAARDAAKWQAKIAPLLDRQALFAFERGKLRLAIPIPEALNLSAPHLFVATPNLVRYGEVQTFMRKGDVLLVEVPLREGAAMPAQVEAILAFGEGEGVRIKAMKGLVPADFGFAKAGPAYTGAPALPWLLLAALAGGLILNVMPCVFPILSLKALSLVRAGGSEAAARREGLAYTAGVVLACLTLGAIMLALRAAGEQVGWAFQLQQPTIVFALFVLAVAITANLAGVFELPSVSLTRRGEPAGAFATGLLAAVAATPCTGPFMAAALGAALLLPAPVALLLFAALGLGLALPFLALGYIPPLRRLLPRPGAWMDAFRRAMAVPMGLTALALVWLLVRLGGQEFALVALVAVFGLALAFVVVGKLQRRGKMAWPAFALILMPFAIFAAIAGPATYSAAAQAEGRSLLDPIPYTAPALAQARASGQPVFVWFTADWCLTCKVNERVAIERDAVREAFAAQGVVAMRGDFTRGDPAIAAYLAEQGAAGVPLYVWYPAGGAGEILPQVLTPDSLLNRARR